MPAEQRYVLGIAYQAGRDERITKGTDGARDYFTPAELEKAAWQFMQGPLEIGVFHADGTLGHATVTESYIYRGPDWQVGDVVVKSGDWLLGAVLDDIAWDLVQKGHVTGWSPQGKARRLTVRSAA
jgi:Putative phage serine protease XkdF